MRNSLNLCVLRNSWLFFGYSLLPMHYPIIHVFMVYFLCLYSHTGSNIYNVHVCFNMHMFCKWKHMLLSMSWFHLWFKKNEYLRQEAKKRLNKLCYFAITICKCVILPSNSYPKMLIYYGKRETTQQYFIDQFDTKW